MLEVVLCRKGSNYHGTDLILCVTLLPNHVIFLVSAPVKYTHSNMYSFPCDILYLKSASHLNTTYSSCLNKGNDHSSGLISSLFTIVYTEGIFGWVSIDNPDQPSLNTPLIPQSTVNLCLIDGCELIDTGRLLTDCWSGVMIDTPLTPWLTFHWHLGRRSTYTWLMHTSRDVDQVPVKMLIKGINELQIPSLHMTDFFILFFLVSSQF